jgi:hypothetical protein
MTDAAEYDARQFEDVRVHVHASVEVRSLLIFSPVLIF